VKLTTGLHLVPGLKMSGTKPEIAHTSSWRGVGTGALSPRVKRPGREADHSTPSSVEVKNVCSYTSIPLMCIHGVVLSEAQGQVYV
jgi:hypothetical protein